MKRDWADEEFRVLMTFGASIVAGGWSSCRERCWASLLSRMINDYQQAPVQLVNLGIGANVISPRSGNYALSEKPSASERLDADVLGYQANGNPLLPDLLVVAYGLNDAAGGTPVDVFRDELRDILNRVRAKIQPLIILLGPYYVTDFTLRAPDWRHASPEVLTTYNEAIRNLAEQEDCLFVDLLQAYGQADWLVHEDAVHANDLGHRVVANEVFNVLARNCSCLSKRTKALEKMITPWRDESSRK